jgi:hypothetical protein
MTGVAQPLGPRRVDPSAAPSEEGIRPAGLVTGARRTDKLAGPPSHRQEERFV